MVSGLYSARNGMMLLQDMVDNTTNNLTNANTTGFKKSLMVSMSEVKTQRNDQALLVHSDKQWMGERVTDWEQGSLVQTGNSMDIALEGNGFSPLRTKPRTMCFMSASGCSGVGFTSPASDLRRAQSVLDFIEVDLRLALGCFSERDDADFIFILRMYD